MKLELTNTIIFGLAYLGCIMMARHRVRDWGQIIFWECIGFIFLIFFIISLVNITYE